YAFSSENWSRPKSEVRTLLDLFLRALNREIRELDDHGVALHFIGDRSAFSRTLREGMLRAEKRTAGNAALRLNVAVNYGGRADIVQAARALARQAAEGDCQPESIDEQRF